MIDECPSHPLLSSLPIAPFDSGFHNGVVMDGVGGTWAAEGTEEDGDAKESEEDDVEHGETEKESRR